MKNKELIKNVPSSGKVAEWDAKETTAGAEQKANAAFEKAKAYADENKVAKEPGKGLSSEDFTKEEKDKLKTLKNYVHPEKHTTTDITTNSDSRFVSDLQISEWNNKETVDGAQGKADKALSDSKAYTEQEINRVDNSKIDFVELQNKEILFKANELEKFRITLPSALDSIPIASQTTLGGIKIGAGLTITEDGILNATSGGVADSILWENIVGKPERFPSMNHIHEVATSNKDGFISKTDKLKLDGLINYVHPSSHPASMIEEDESRKFISNKQIDSFNDKYTKVETTNLLKRKIDNVEFFGNTLKFYADSVKKIEIEIPSADFNTILNKPSTFNPPIASTTILGGIKVGKGLSVLEDGTLNATGRTPSWDTITNKPESLNKITDLKISEWDNKETTSGSQQKADKALSESKKYTDQRMLKTRKMNINLFNYDKDTGLYKATVIHNLNTESIFISAYNMVTKESQFLGYKIIDKNTIEITTENDSADIDLFIMGGEFVMNSDSVLINDSSVGLDTTWSSQKIDTEFKKYAMLTGQVTSISEKLDGVDLEVKSMKESTGKISTIESDLSSVKNNIEQQNSSNQSTFSLLRTDINKKVSSEDLLNSGGCQINGENIQAGTLSVDLIKSNNENPIIKLFDQCAIDATANSNQGKGDSIRLKWDDNNYIKISATDIAFYNNGKATLRVRDDSNPVISFYGATSIDATDNNLRMRANNNDYLSVMSGEARFYIGGTNVVKINSRGIVQGLPAQVNSIPAKLTKGNQTTFSEFVANEFGNAIVLDENNKLAIDTSKITTPEMKELLAEEDGSYSYSGCIAVLTMALKEEIQSRKTLEAIINK